MVRADYQAALRRRLHDLVWEKSTYAYRGPADFVLRHGQFYEPSAFPLWLRPGAPKMCFGNALLNAGLHGWQYIEGYALVPSTLELALHAWNVDAGGSLIDTTWRNSGLCYLGVPFLPERAEEATWKGDGAVLHDPLRDWPVLQQEWRGELDQWPTLNEFVERLRQGDVPGAYRILAERPE